MNRVILSGNLTRDPEVRYSKDGRPYARMGIAVNRTYSKEKITDFFNMTAFGKTAEFCGNYLKKGSRVIVEGNLQTSNYENKDGVKVTSVDIMVDNVEFGDTKRPGDDDNNYSGRKSSGNDYQKNNYSNRREQAPPRRKNNDFDDDFGGEPIDPEDTPF